MNTRSIFYYGHRVDEDNCYIDFNEGGLEITAQLNTGDYTATEFAAEVARAMNVVGGQVYTCVLQRATRQLLFEAAGFFEFMPQSGSHSTTSAFVLMGVPFDIDNSGSGGFTTGTETGKSYQPQFILQDYVPKENNVMAQQASVIEAVDGNIEVVRFGVLSMIEMNIKWATNIFQPGPGPIYNNATGVEDLNEFMRYICSKAPIEFMENVNARTSYSRIILESTATDNKGTNYKLKERHDMGLPGYYETGLLTFRVVN